MVFCFPKHIEEHNLITQIRDSHGPIQQIPRRTRSNILIILGEKHGAMVRHGDVILGEVTTPPRLPPLPLGRPRIRRPQSAEERDQEVLVQGVSDEPDPLPSDGFEERRRVDAGEGAGAATGGPGPGVDAAHVGPVVAEAVPGVAMEGAGGVVERGAGVGP